VAVSATRLARFNLAAAYTEFGTNTKFKFTTFGGSYDFGIAKVSGLYSINDYSPHKQDLYTIAVTAPVGVGSVWTSYTNASYKQGNAVKAVSGDSYQLAAGYVHNLSKRTALYTTVSYIDNKAGANFGVNGAGASANPAVVADGRSGGVDVGVRHSF